jgi:hypothetical protein
VDGEVDILDVLARHRDGNLAELDTRDDAEADNEHFDGKTTE